MVGRTDYVYHTSLERGFLIPLLEFFNNAVINILLIASFKMATACCVPFSLPLTVSEI
jgi:hypothetical protein